MLNDQPGMDDERINLNHNNKISELTFKTKIKMMLFKKGYFFICLILAGLFGGCSPSTPRGTSSATLECNVNKTPFSVELMQAGKRVGAITGGNMAGLFYITRQDTQYITKVRKVIANKENRFE